jgi:hypothetical protein
MVRNWSIFAWVEGINSGQSCILRKTNSERGEEASSARYRA